MFIFLFVFRAARAQIETPNKPGLSDAGIDPFISEWGLSDTGFNPDSGIDDESIRDGSPPGAYEPGGGSIFRPDNAFAQPDGGVLESGDPQEAGHFSADRANVLSRLEKLQTKLESIEEVDPIVWQTHYQVIDRNLDEVRMSLDAVKASDTVEP